MRNSKIVLIFILLTMLLVGGVVILNQKSKAPITLESLDDDSTISLSYKNSELTLPVAASEAKQEQGLMNVVDFKKDEGMFFVFKTMEPQTFWMKDTPSSLDMIFLDNNLKIVKFYSNTKPSQIEEVYPSTKPIQYAIEVKAGWIDENNPVVDENISIKKITQ